MLYQGKTTVETHGVPLTPEQKTLGVTNQIVSILVSIMSPLLQTTPLPAWTWCATSRTRTAGTRTVSDNRIGKPPLKSIKELEKKAVSRGTSDDGILALRWKDNKIITLLSTDT